MLGSPSPPPLRACNIITGASKAGLVARVDGVPRDMPWTTITGIAAGLIQQAEIEQFVLALTVEDSSGSRSFLVAESEPVWVQLTSVLHLGLPNVAPYTAWGAALAASPTVIDLFEWPKSS